MVSASMGFETKQFQVNNLIYNAFSEIIKNNIERDLQLSVFH